MYYPVQTVKRNHCTRVNLDNNWYTAGQAFCKINTNCHFDDGLVQVQAVHVPLAVIEL